jgi:transposase
MATELNLTLEQQEARRLLAGQMFQQGQSPPEVARSLQVARSSAYRWKTAFEKGGFDALKAKKHTGAKPRLNARQKKRLVKILLDGPVKAGYSNHLWTCPRVAQVIERNFHVKYHPGHVWYLLRNLGWTCQTPEQQAREGDEAEMQRWRREKWPRIKGGHAVS